MDSAPTASDKPAYTVPDQILFRNFEVLTSGTRSLLLQNKTRTPLQAYCSCPFTRHFRLVAQDVACTHSACASPQHVSLTVQPGVPAKLTLELLVPDDETLKYIQGERERDAQRVREFPCHRHATSLWP